MRLVKLEHLKEGEIIGEDILNEMGSILLRKGHTFKEVYRQRLKEADIEMLFIDDELSKGIEPVYALSKAVKQAIIRDIKKEFGKIKQTCHINIDEMNKITEIVASEIAQTDLVCEMVDIQGAKSSLYEHSVAVTIMATMVARKMRLKEEQVKDIITGALLHDIGKTQLKAEIIEKAERNEEEERVYREHVDLGYKMIKDDITISSITKVIVLCHHEREDGSGYPLQKKEELHIGAKIVAICDYFQNLINQGLPLTYVILKSKAQKFDPEIRKLVENTLAFYPVGSLVKLSTGEIAVVEKNYTDHLHRPDVCIVNTEANSSSAQVKIHLQQQEEINIVCKLETIE